LAPSSNLDLAINALALIRTAQHAIDAALRLPGGDRAAVAGQVEAVRRSVDEVASSLAAAVPGGQSLVSAGQALGGGLASRPELRPVGAMISFFADQGSQALGALSGAAGSLGGERDRSLVLSERITDRLAEVGVATRTELARELEVDPDAAEFRDALERTLGTGHAEWYGSGTYGLPRARLETMIARARAVSEDAAIEDQESPAPRPPEAPTASSDHLDAAVGELRSSVDALRAAVAGRAGAGAAPPTDPPPGSG
jgi:hypothetical protein